MLPHGLQGSDAPKNTEEHWNLLKDAMTDFISRAMIPLLSSVQKKRLILPIFVLKLMEKQKAKMSILLKSVIIKPSPQDFRKIIMYYSELHIIQAFSLIYYQWN